MSLPIVKNQRLAVTLPSAVVDTLMKTAAGSIEAAQYFVSRYKEGLGKNAPALLVQKLDEWEKLVISELTESQTKWYGEYVERNPLANSLLNLSEEAIINSDIASAENLHLDFAINSESKFVRGYSSNNESLSEEALEALDLSFNAWLAEQNVIVDGGILYQMDAKEKRNPVDYKKMEQLIKEDFKAYMQKKNIEIDIEQQEFPREPEAAPFA